MPGRRPQPISSLALIATRYELVRELRQGDDSVDWEAFDAALERPVVIELLRPELANDTAAARRFWARARSVARAVSPVGERVLDAGTDPDSGQPFVVREWPAAGASEAAYKPRPRAQRLALDLADLVPVSPRWLKVGAVALTLAIAGIALKPGVERLQAWLRVDDPIRVPPGLGLIRDPRGDQSDSTSLRPAPTAERPAPIATTAPTAAPTPSATATPLSGGQPRRIVNTDGRGVALRASPGGNRLPGKGYDEGATVQAFEQNGAWTRIRGSDGREGWVLSVTLAP